MEEKEYITIVGDDGEEVEFELLTVLEDSENGSKYVVYTDNLEDSNGDVNIYTSKVNVVDGKEELIDLTDEEWNSVKEVLDEIMNEEDED